MRNIGEFWSLPKTVAERTDLTVVDKLVLAILWTRRNGENVSWPSQENMAKQLGVTARSVIRALERLAKVGLVAVNRQGAMKSNEYTIDEDEVTKSHITDEVTKSHHHSDKLSHVIVTKSHTKRTSEDNTEDNTTHTPGEMAREWLPRFLSGETMYVDGSSAVVDALAKKGIPIDIVQSELKKFALYWTEPTKSGKKQRWELQPTFDIRRRLATWFTNVARYAKPLKETKGVRI